MPTTGEPQKRQGFKRISRARIFAGHPLKVSIYAAATMVLAGLGLTAVLFLIFAIVHRVDFSLMFWVLLPGAVLGYLLLVLERLLGQLKGYLVPRMGKLITAFLLFFAPLR